MTKMKNRDVSDEQAVPKVLTFGELRELGVVHSRRQVDRLEAKNLFPKRVKLSDHRVGWVSDEIKAHVRKKIASRSNDVGSLGSQIK